MNEKEKTNPLNNPEEHDKLVLELKTEITNKTQEVETWKNAKIKVEQQLFEKERENARLLEDKQDLRRQIQAQRRIELDKKETREGNDFLTSLTEKLDKKIEQTQNKHK